MKASACIAVVVDRSVRVVWISDKYLAQALR